MKGLGESSQASAICAGGNAPAGAEVAQEVDHSEVGLQRLGREPREGGAQVAWVVEAVTALDGAGEEALAERPPGHEADAQFLTERECALLGLPHPQGVVVLHGRYRLLRMGATDALYASLGQAEVLHLP
jgi:hypothetical protein